MTTNAEKIRDWRIANSDTPITETILKRILEVETLRGIDLSEAVLDYAVFSGADLSGADFYHASLRYADLHQANLSDALLAQADMFGAILEESNLYKADLQRANLGKSNINRANLTETNLVEANLHAAETGGAMTFTGLPSGDGYFVPTPNGWRISIEYWADKTLEELRAIANNQAEFAGLLAMCEAHAAAYPGIIDELAALRFYHHIS